MENKEKQYIVAINNTGKIIHISRQFYEDAKRKPANQQWQIVGLVQPDNVQEMWYVNEDEKNNGIVNRKPFHEFTSADSYFKITSKSNNTFIEGNIGHPTLSSDFFDEIDKYYTYFKDYLARKKIYFTFDRITLYQLTEIQRSNPLKVTLQRIDNLPYFEKNTAFMIMPFKDKRLDIFYKEQIKKFLEDSFGIKIYRADDFTDNDVIIETIYKCIEESEFIIAETTANNKNVFYELGYADAKEKEIISLQDISELNIFFDRAHRRTIIYSLEDIEKFQAELSSTIQTIRARK